MFKFNELKVNYFLTQGPLFRKINTIEELFCVKYPLSPSQTQINLILIKQIMCKEINIYNVEEYRYFHPSKKGYMKITNTSSYPIESNEIILQIQLKPAENKELIELKKINETLELKLKEYEKIKTIINECYKQEKIDFYFLYAFPMEETKGCDQNSIIAYHLEMAKLVDIFKNSKKGFNAIFESVNVQKLKEAIREEPRVIHISCHGRNPKHIDGYALKFEDKGKKIYVTENELEELLSNLKEHLMKIDLVFLSSCHSEVAGNIFAKYVKNVICIKKDYPVSNTASLNFAIYLYQSLIECNSVKYSFEFAQKELFEQEKKKSKNKSRNIILKQHKESCFLYIKFSDYCSCNVDEFCCHTINCNLLLKIKMFNDNKKNKNKFKVEKVDSNILKICCGCDKEEIDLPQIGESYKFKYKGKNKECEDLIIYKNNKNGGEFKHNNNCFIVKDKVMYNKYFLLLIERREIVTEIYDKIENEIIQFFIVYGDSGVGKFNFAESVFIYLFERSVVNKLYLKKARSFDIIKGEIDLLIKKKDEKKYEDEKYIVIIEIDNELQAPLNLVNKIINEESFTDKKFYFFLLLRTSKDIANLVTNKEKAKLIHLKNLSEPKALQLLMEIKNVYTNFEKDYITKEEMKELLRLINYSRKEIFPLLLLIEEYNNYNDVKNEIIQKVKAKSETKTRIKFIMESEAGKIIFILYMMNKGLPSSVLKLFEPEFKRIIKTNEAEKFFYQKYHSYWKISKIKITNEDIIYYILNEKRKLWIENILEITAKLLFHFDKIMKKNVYIKYFKNLEIEYYFYYFFENIQFMKSFNKEKYEQCFLKEPNYLKYENIINNKDINLEDLKDNIFNLFEINNETINTLYSEDEKMKEYIEQIIIILPKLFIKNKPELKNILVKIKNIINNLKNIDSNNLLKINLFSILFEENNEINFDEFDALDKEAKAFAYFINGLRISKISFRDSVNKSKKIKINLLIEKEKESFKQALTLFKNNNTMKAYCFYQLGNLEYELKNFGEAEKYYKEGSSIPNLEKFINCVLNLKIAIMLKDKILNKIDKKQEFNEIIKTLIDSEDLRFINEASDLEKKIKEKILPDIIVLNTEVIIKEELLKFSNDTNPNLFIKFKDLNEDNLREAFSRKGKILIIQTNNFNKEGDILLDSGMGNNYSLAKKYFNKISKINYEVLILCFINSGKLIKTFKNKVKYLITFDQNYKIIFNNKDNETLLLEYKRCSIDFLKNFISYIEKCDIENAFENSYDIFKAKFKDVCNRKKFDKFNFITLTVNNQIKVKKCENIKNENKTE